MFEYEYSLEADVTPEAVWKLYNNAASWPTWDTGTEKVGLSGPLAAGTTGNIKFSGQDPLPFRILSAQPNREFTDETEIPGADIFVQFTHRLTPLESGGTRITQRVSITGPAAETLGPQIGPGITSDIPQSIAALIALAKSSQA
jgi:uncharacterized protein YndB with AHSA1/START domain